MAERAPGHEPTGPLSSAEEAALRALHRGWRLGIDSASEQGLIGRQLIRLGDWRLGALTIHDMPFLTDTGERVAAHLVAEQELARRSWSDGGFSIHHGGLA